MDEVAMAVAPPRVTLRSFRSTEQRERLGTGDRGLDALLGGGIMTGSILEVAGERSVGRTHDKVIQSF